MKIAVKAVERIGRDLTGLRILRTAADVVNCLREDPNDRVFHSSSDLCPSDFGKASSTRSYDTIYVVRSLKAVGANSINDYVHTLRSEGYFDGIRSGEIAVVGEYKSPAGRIVPSDIKQLLRDAEESIPGAVLGRAGYEGLCVLATSPAALNASQ